MTLNNLKNKRILLFSPAFFGYEIKIKNKLIELGAEVDMFDERSIHKSYQKALLKINPNIFKHVTEQYYFDIFEKIKDKEYNYILFIKCEMPTINILKKYKNHFKQAKMCLYMWDSIRNIPNIEKKFDYFDIISSFDKYDCQKNTKIKFRPLFYSDDYKIGYRQNKYKYDICFIGTIHSDRFKILKEVERQCSELGLKLYIYPYLQSKFIYYFYKITKKEFKNTKLNDFVFTKISSHDIVQKVNDSNIIIDIQHSKQSGLTMRTIEMLGMNKKIMTTNEDIINYNFYNKNNIQVINRVDIKINKNLIYNNYMPIEEKIYNYYYIESWIYNILGDFNND